MTRFCTASAIAVFLLAGGTVCAQVGDPWLEAVRALPAGERSDAIEARIQAAGGTPLVVEGGAILLVRSEGRPRVVGDFNAWGNAGQDAETTLEPIAGTSWHARRVSLPPDARVEYLVDAGDGTLRVDPLNPRQVRWTDRAYSEIAMPGYRTPDEVTAALAAPEPSTTRFAIESAALGGRRDVVVLTIAREGAAQARPMFVYFLDGRAWIEQGLAPRILFQLVEHGRLPPLVAVFTDPGDRAAEYNLSERFRRFFWDELVPRVEAQAARGERPPHRAVVGSSLGALAALDLALRDPERLPFAAVFSLTTQRHAESAWLPAAPPRRPAVHLVECLYDWRWLGDSRAAAAALQRGGVPVTVHTIPQGHNFGAWRDALVATMRAIAPER